MPAVTCRYIRTNGARCGSPALSGHTFCYHHTRVAHHHRGLAPQPAAALALADPEPLVLDFPPLEDRESIQLAVSMLVNAMAQNRIDPRRATAMLYGLQVASANCGRITPPPPQDLVRDVVLEDGQPIAPDVDPAPEPADTLVTRLAGLLEDDLAATPAAPVPPEEPLPPTAEPASEQQQALALAQARLLTQQSPAEAGPAVVEPPISTPPTAVVEVHTAPQPDRAAQHGSPTGKS